MVSLGWLLQRHKLSAIQSQLLARQLYVMLTIQSHCYVRSTSLCVVNEEHKGQQTQENLTGQDHAIPTVLNDCMAIADDWISFQFGFVVKPCIHCRPLKRFML